MIQKRNRLNVLSVTKLVITNKSFECQQKKTESREACQIEEAYLVSIDDIPNVIQMSKRNQVINGV